MYVSTSCELYTGRVVDTIAFVVVLAVVQHGNSLAINETFFIIHIFFLNFMYTLLYHSQTRISSSNKEPPSLWLLL